MRHGAAAALLIGVSTLTQAESPKEPVAWLVEINDAARTSNYQGVVVYRAAQVLETMRVTHRYQNGEEREHMMSLSGEPREILRRNHQMSVVYPKTRTVSVEADAPQGLFPIMSQDTVDALINNYSVRAINRDRVAGRVCRNLSIRPRDAYRYGYEMCVDEERRIALRTSLIDTEDRILEQTLFSEISFPAQIADAALASNTDTRGFENLAPTPQPQIAQATAWKLPPLPPGFRLKLRDVRAFPGAPGMVEHLLLTDGLSMVSVYSTAAQVQQPGLQGLSNAGGVNAFGRVVGPFHVTVVGEVPQATVKMIGEGLVAPEETAP